MHQAAPHVGTGALRADEPGADRPTGRPRARIAGWVGLGVAVYAVTYAFVLANRANRVDEAWMLWVTERMTRGDRLYADIYYVTTPLAAWISAAVASIGGVQLTVLRALETLVFTIEFLLAMSVARWCRVSRSALVVFGGLLFVVGSPATEWISLYSSVAILCALVALRTLLAWYRSRDEATPPNRFLLLGAGAACGLSFASKPNVGLLVLAAALVTVLVNGPTIGAAGWWRSPVRVVAGFAGVVVVTVLPVLIAGSWDPFVSQVFADKADYLEVGTSYATTLERQGEVLWRLFTEGERPLRVLHSVTVILPVLVLAGAIVALLRARRTRRGEAAMFAAFSVAALGSMFPRPGSNHLAGVAPLAFTGLLGALAAARPWSTRPVVRRTVVAVTGIAVTTAFVVIAVHGWAGYHDSHVTRSGYAHFRGTAVPTRFADARDDLRVFARTHDDGALFILREDAGFWYLTTGAHNPLPFDIPEVSDFGAEGQAGVIARLRRGDAHWVCLKPLAEEENGPLEPRVIARWVRNNFHFVESIRQCDIYERRR